MDKLKVALERLSQGEFVIVTDDENRENEGDLVIAADRVTPGKIAFMIRHTTGIVCVSMTEERLKALELPQMVAHNTGPRKTAFTISVDARGKVTTGVSAKDRTETILALSDPATQPSDLSRPGHIFPLRYKEGGVLKRAGHTEAAVDLMKLAGLEPISVICEIVSEDGSMARMPELKEFSMKHDIPMISVADLIRYRRIHEKLVDSVSEATIPSAHGNFTGIVYTSKLDHMEHLALVRGEVRNKKDVLVRVHSECLTGDVFGSKRCDCGSQLDLAMKTIAKEGTGVIIYLRGHEGRGIGLAHKLKAYNLQEQGHDTVDANKELGLPVDSREYGIGAQILVDLGLSSIRLMTNNPLKYRGLSGYDLEITERVPLQSGTTDENRDYLQTKKDRLGHLLEV